MTLPFNGMDDTTAGGQRLAASGGERQATVFRSSVGRHDSVKVAADEPFSAAIRYR